MDFASRFLGDEASHTYRIMLNIMEDKILRCRDKLLAAEDDEWDEDHTLTCTTTEIANAMGASCDDTELNGELSVCQDLLSARNGQSGQKHPSMNHSSFDAIKGGKKLVNHHLKLLAEDPRRFVTKVGMRGEGEWKVEFHHLDQLLIQFEIENFVTANYGSVATRILRILHYKGKLDEKKIGDFALLRPRDLRSALTALQASGIVDVQSVPKDASRQTPKTIFLWFFDQDQCRRLLLGNTYKVMARLTQRMSHEKKNYQSVLEKAQRTDVVGNEIQYLSNAERLALNAWNSTEKRLFTHIWRLDDLVSILRDFC